MTTRERSMGDAVDIRCFPSEDADFADLVFAIVAEILEPDTGTHEVDGFLRSVEDRLRTSYPNAIVRRRDMLAEFGVTSRQLWYAFRDGTVG